MKIIYFTYILVLLFFISVSAKAIIENESDDEEEILAEKSKIAKISNIEKAENEIAKVSNVEKTKNENVKDNNIEKAENEKDSNVEKAENEKDNNVEKAETENVKINKDKKTKKKNSKIHHHHHHHHHNHHHHDKNTEKKNEKFHHDKNNGKKIEKNNNVANSENSENEDIEASSIKDETENTEVTEVPTENSENEDVEISSIKDETENTEITEVPTENSENEDVEISSIKDETENTEVTEIPTEIPDTFEAAQKFYDKYENVEKDILYNDNNKLDVYYNPKDTKIKKPVNIYIFGGSWVSNDKVTFSRLGALLEKEDYIGVIPNFDLYPNGKFDDMVSDIHQAIQWTYNNIEKYGGDKDDISITGHSSGAHLVALTVIRAALGLPNNGAPLEPLPPLNRVILMNGPYIFNEDFMLYTLQGSTSTSNATSTDDPKEQALLTELIGLYFNNDDVSPIALLRRVEKDSVKDHFNVEKFTFVYSSKDIIVPEFCTKDLMTEIIRTSSSQLEYVYFEGLDHSSIINGVKTEKVEFENLYLDILEK